MDYPGPIPFKSLHDDAVLPTRAYPTDAGLDLTPLGGYRLEPGTTTRVRTGLSTAIAPGWVGLVADRSSLGSRSITVFGRVIDSAYRGEIGVLLHNASPVVQEVGVLDDEGRRRPIAQLLVVPCSVAVAEWVDELPESDRGEGGFGHTDERASSP